MHARAHTHPSTPFSLRQGPHSLPGPILTPAPEQSWCVPRTHSCHPQNFLQFLGPQSCLPQVAPATSPEIMVGFCCYPSLCHKIVSLGLLQDGGSLEIGQRETGLSSGSPTSAGCLNMLKTGEPKERGIRFVFFYALTQHFSNFSKHQNHLEGFLKQTAESHPVRVSDSVGPGYSEVALRPSSQVMLMLLVQNPTFRSTESTCR